MTELEQLRAQIAALTVQQEQSAATVCFLINVCSACVEAIGESAAVVATARPDIAAQADQIIGTWKQFLAGAEIARSVAQFQNAPTTGARQ